MLSQINALLNTFSQSHGDPRTHLCRLEAAALEEGRLALRGVVLDQETLAAAQAALLAALPSFPSFPAVSPSFDLSAVQVLRPGRPAAVATNLTGLYAQPSWLAEQVSQLLDGQPLEVLQEEGRWALVRQADGYLGWAYAAYLTEALPPSPSHLVAEAAVLLRDAPREDAALVGRTFIGTAMAVVETRGGWSCLRLASGVVGWAPAAALRDLGALPQDPDARRAQMALDAQQLIGVPYLWGGCTALGIDCSGFVQLLHRLVGVTIPRDADMQFAAGRPVDPPYRPGDLFFFGGDGHRAISHVGMSLGGWRMVHASRSRNGVYVDDVQAVPHLRDAFVGARTFVVTNLPIAQPWV